VQKHRRGEVLFGAASAISGLRSLNAFDAVVRSGSVSAAAATLRVAQPAASRLIAKLEREVGSRLFDRSRAGAVLTAEGKTFHQRTTRFHSQLRNAINAYVGGVNPTLLGAILGQITLAQANVLAGVTEAGSLADAAGILGMSANNLRRSLRSLEQVLGRQMLWPTGSGPALNDHAVEFGRRLLLAGREIESGLAELLLSRGIEGGRTSVGAPPHVAYMLLTKPLLEFSRTYSRTPVEVVDGDYDVRLQLLRRGAIDMTLGHLQEDAPGDIRQEPLVRDRYVVVVRADHPALDGDLPGLRRLARYAWIVPARAGRRAAFEKLYPNPLARPNVTLGTYSRTVTRAMLLESDQVSILSRSEVILDERHKLLTALPYKEIRAEYTIALLTRQDWMPTPPQAALAELLRSYAWNLAAPSSVRSARVRHAAETAGGY
jgi:DNA-binding transcriptional LysR family regulator